MAEGGVVHAGRPAGQDDCQLPVEESERWCVLQRKRSLLLLHDDARLVPRSLRTRGEARSMCAPCVRAAHMERPGMPGAGVPIQAGVWWATSAGVLCCHGAATRRADAADSSSWCWLASSHHHHIIITSSSHHHGAGRHAHHVTACDPRRRATGARLT